MADVIHTHNIVPAYNYRGSDGESFIITVKYGGKDIHGHYEENVEAYRVCGKDEQDAVQRVRRHLRQYNIGRVTIVGTELNN